ncbi:MAG TPA: hypothetical protein V6D46_10190 [Coleofasciculaceae cyanobacterium]
MVESSEQSVVFQQSKGSPAPMHRNRWVGHVTNAAIALLAIGGIITHQRATIERAPKGLEDPDLAQDRTRTQLQLAAKLPSLGFDNVLANWAFLSYLQYFGDTEVRQATGYTANEDYFEVMTLRDPRFTTLAPFISAGVAYYAGKPEKSVALMTRMTDALDPQRQPDAFWVWRFKAFDQYLLLNDIPATITSLEMAGRWAAVTQKYRSVAPFFQETADFLRRDPNTQAVRFYAWNEVYQAAVDSLVIQRAEQELLAMGAKRGQKLPNGRYQFLAPPANSPASSQRNSQTNSPASSPANSKNP